MRSAFGSPLYRATALQDPASATQFLQAYALRRRHVVGHEEIDLQALRRVGPILVEIGDALAGQERVVDEEIAGEGLRLVEDRVSSIGQDLRRTRHAHQRVAADDRSEEHTSELQP